MKFCHVIFFNLIRICNNEIHRLQEVLTVNFSYTSGIIRTMQCNAIPCVQFFQYSSFTTMGYNHAIQYHVVPCQNIRCNIILCNAIPNNTMQHHIIAWKTMKHHNHAKLYGKLPCNTVQYHEFTYNTVQYHIIWEVSFF